MTKSSMTTREGRARSSRPSAKSASAASENGVARPERSIHRQSLPAANATSLASVVFPFPAEPARTNGAPVDRLATAVATACCLGNVGSGSGGTPSVQNFRGTAKDNDPAALAAGTSALASALSGTRIEVAFSKTKRKSSLVRDRAWGVFLCATSQQCRYRSSITRAEIEGLNPCSSPCRISLLRMMSWMICASGSSVIHSNGQKRPPINPWEVPVSRYDLKCGLLANLSNRNVRSSSEDSALPAAAALQTSIPGLRLRRAPCSVAIAARVRNWNRTFPGERCWRCQKWRIARARLGLPTIFLSLYL